MNRAVRFGAVTIIAGLALAVGYKALASRYLQPRATLLAQVEIAQATLDKQREAREDMPRVATELNAIVDRTLGGDVETVDHRLRTRLSRLAEGVGFDGPPVSTGAATRRLSPARTAFKSRELRDEFDFIELPGFVNGQGTFEQALALVASIEAEPWIKRIDELKFDPADNGSRFDVSIRLTTLFLPGRTPGTSGTPVSAAVAAPLPGVVVSTDQYPTFAALNPFRIPPAPPQAAPAPAGVPPDPVGEPEGLKYQHWRLTGVAHSPAGPEVWLLNTQTRDPRGRRLLLGQSIHDMELIAVGVDRAEFRLGDERFAVEIGRNLADRQARGQ
jgi:hypothetical protein